MRSGLQLDLGCHLVLGDAGDDARDVVPGGLAPGVDAVVLTGDLDRQAGKVGAVDISPPTGSRHRAHPPGLGPSTHGVGAYPHQLGGAAGPVLGHCTYGTSTHRMPHRGARHAGGMQDKARSAAPVAGILLTGGRSRRMGFDKASIAIDGVPAAVRTARVLSAVAFPVVEVGPGRSGLASVREDPPGSGPLAAIAAGVRSLSEAGHDGAVLVVACDLPLLTEAALGMLAEWPGRSSVVPVVAGHPQPLCARWSGADLGSAAGLVDAGKRSMKALLSRPGIVFLDESSWPRSIEVGVLSDADTPTALDRLGLRWHPRRPSS